MPSTNSIGDTVRNNFAQPTTRSCQAYLEFQSTWAAFTWFMQYHLIALVPGLSSSQGLEYCDQSWAKLEGHRIARKRTFQPVSVSIGYQVTVTEDRSTNRSHETPR